MPCEQIAVYAGLDNGPRRGHQVILSQSFPGERLAKGEAGIQQVIGDNGGFHSKEVAYRRKMREEPIGYCQHHQIDNNAAGSHQAILKQARNHLRAQPLRLGIRALGHVLSTHLGHHPQRLQKNGGGHFALTLASLLKHDRHFYHRESRF